MGINCECGVPTVQGEHLSERGCALSKHVKYLYGRVEGLSEQDGMFTSKWTLFPSKMGCLRASGHFFRARWNVYEQGDTFSEQDGMFTSKWTLFPSKMGCLRASGHFFRASGIAIRASRCSIVACCPFICIRDGINQLLHESCICAKLASLQKSCICTKSLSIRTKTVFIPP